MVYLDNTIEQQTVWIPRNDGQGVPHKPSTNLEIGEITVTADTQTNYPSSGYVGFSSVVIDSSEYAQHNYDLGYSEGENDGYVSGVTDGEQSIIDTFTSTTITENGQYGSSANPYSSVTVNVAQTGHTDEELQEAYESGYTSGSTDGFNSGETHQKSLLVSTAITQNGSYSRENGYSAITVNVPTGQTYNIEANHSFTATTNGNYTIKPSEIWSITYDNTFARRYVFTINGTIPQSFVNDTAYIISYYDENTGEEPSVSIIIGSGNTLTINKNGWDEDDYGDVDFMLWQGKYRLEFDNDNLHTPDFSIIPYSNKEKYNAMSAVSLTVNVTSSVPKYVEYIETDGSEIMFDLDTMLTSLDEVVYFDFMPLSGVGQYDGWYSFVDADNFGLRTCWGGYGVNGKYGYKFGNYYQFNNWSIGPSFSAGTKYECVFTSTGSSVNDIATTYQASSIGTPSNIHLNGWDGDGDISRCPIARYYGFKIMSGNTVVSDFRPCLDTNNVPCFYEEVSQTYIYASGSGTPISGPTFDYASGYTDGYASGFTDGQSGGSEDFVKLIDRSITNIVIPSGVTKIGDYAFGNCRNLKSITIPNSVTSINNDAFYGCYALSSITIPSGVTSLGAGCFYSNFALSSITIPNSVTNLGTQIFYNCQALTSVTFSNSLTEIPNSCCSGCKLLPNVTIPNSIDKIYNYSFQNCSALTEVNIGSGVTKIEVQAFRNCIALANIYISATTAPTIANANAFQGVPSTGTVHYPQGSDYSSWQSNTYLSGWTFIADL